MRQLVRPQQVAPPQLQAVDPQLPGRRVEQPLACEGALEAPRRAVGAARRLVREHDVRGALVGRDVVGPGQHAERQLGDDDPVRAQVGAVVVPQLVAQREQAVLLVEGGLEAVQLLARVVGGDEVLRAVLDPLDGSPERAREVRDEQILGVELPAHAEAAAGVRAPDRHALLRHAERGGEETAVEVRDLRHAPDGEAVRAVLGDEAARLQRHRAVAADLDLERDDARGRREGAVDVAEAAAQHRARLAGQRVEHRLELLVLDPHQLLGVLGQVGVLGADDGDRLADVAHAVVRQRRLQERVQVLLEGPEAQRDRRQVGQVGGAQHGVHAGQLAGALGLDRPAASRARRTSARPASTAARGGRRRRRSARRRAGGGRPRGGAPPPLRPPGASRPPGGRPRGSPDSPCSGTGWTPSRRGSGRRWGRGSRAAARWRA